MRRPLPWLLGTLLVVAAGGWYWVSLHGRDYDQEMLRPPADDDELLQDPVWTGEVVSTLVLPRVARAHWGAVAPQASHPRPLRGRLLQADGSPAAGLPYWLAVAPPPPPDVLLGELPAGSLARPDRAALGATGAAGEWTGALLAAGPAFLVVAVADGLRLVYQVEDGAAPRLPALADAEFACASAAASDAWRVRVTPVFPDPRRAAARLAATAALRPLGPGAWLALAAQYLREPAVATLHLRLPRDQVYAFDLDGVGFDVVPTAVEGQPPLQQRVSLQRRFPLLAVAVVEGDARTACALAGEAVLGFAPDPAESRQRVPLALGLATLDLRAPLDARYTLRVRMADGEVFWREFTAAEVAAAPRLECVRGTGRPGLRGRWPPRPDADPLQYWIEVENGSFVPLLPAERFAFQFGDAGFYQPGPDGTVAFGGLDPGWRQIVCVAADGAVGRAVAAAGDRLEGAWLGLRPVPVPDLRSLWEQHGGGATGQVFLDVEVRARAGQPFKIAVAEWTVAGDALPWPVWAPQLAEGCGLQLRLFRPRQPSIVLPLGR